MLARMFSGQYSVRKDDQNRYFIDRDGAFCALGDANGARKALTLDTSSTTFATAHTTSRRRSVRVMVLTGSNTRIVQAMNSLPRPGSSSSVK